MLVSLSVSNVLSIDGPIEFSMEASKESLHQERVAEVPGGRLLQASAIWGGNASGKSNFCEVLHFAQHLIVVGTLADRPTGRVPFKLRKKAVEEPSRFEFEILVDDKGEEKLFRYAFAITGKTVVSESLAEIRKASEKTYFTRSAATDGQPVFTLDWWGRKGVLEEERQFAGFVAKGTKPNQLFLHEAMDRNMPLLAPVFCWFRDQLVVLEPGAVSMPLEIQESNREELRGYVADILRRADTGIIGIRPVEVQVATLPMPPKQLEALLDEIKEEDGGISLLAPSGQRFSVFRKQGELIAARIVTLRRDADGEEVQFEMNDESDGTLRLFDLAPAFHDLGSSKSRKVYVIDELDRSMHTHLASALVELYFSTLTKDTRSQLIFTTHDSTLMEQRLFRRDEIWFIQRGVHGNTEMESLSNYKDVRHDKDIRKAYLLGRFSGVPHLKSFGGRPWPAGSKEPELFDRLNEAPSLPPASKHS